MQSVTVDSKWPAGPHRPVRYCLHGDIGNKVALAFPREAKDGEVTVVGRWGGLPQPRLQKVHVQPPPLPLDLCERRVHRALKCLAQLLADVAAAADAGDGLALRKVQGVVEPSHGRTRFLIPKWEVGSA